MVDPDKTPERGLQLSGELTKVRRADLNASGPIRIGSGDALATEVRASLELAQATGHRVAIALRGDLERGVPVRVIEGTIEEFNATVDGRVRVRIAISPDAEQLVLVEKIVRVVPVG